MTALDGLLESEREVWVALMGAVRIAQARPTLENLKAVHKLGKRAYRTPTPAPRTEGTSRLFFQLANGARSALPSDPNPIPEVAALRDQTLADLVGLCDRAALFLDPRERRPRGLEDD